MPYIPHGAIAAAHAERERKRQEEEEEKMTTYNKEELDIWEFKIVRSDSGAFRKPDTFQVLIDEEAMSGWEMLEKLDDRRVRFKRLKSARNNDFSLPPGIDPYRSHYGGSQTRFKIVMVMGILILGIFLAGYLFVAKDSSAGDFDWGNIAVSIPVIGTLIALVGVAFVIKRRG